MHIAAIDQCEVTQDKAIHHVGCTGKAQGLLFVEVVIYPSHLKTMALMGLVATLV